MKTPIIFLAGTSLVSFAMILALSEVFQTSSEEISIFRKLREIPKDIRRSINAIYLAGLIEGFALGVMSIALISYIIEIVAGDPAILCLLMSFMGISAIPSLLISGYISDRFKRRKPLVILGYVSGSVGIIPVPLISNFYILLFLGMFISFIFSIADPALRALQADLITSDVRGTVFGALQLFFNGGTLVGVILSGWITNLAASYTIHIFKLSFSGYIIPFWITAFLLITETLIFLLYVKEKEDRVDISS